VKFSYCLGGDPLLKTVKVGVTVANAGVVVLKDTNKYGHVKPCTATASADSMGLALQAATYATSLEATTQIIMNPFAVLRAKCSGAAAEDTALTVLENTGASTTVFSSTSVGTADMTGGTVFMLSGANAGLSRVVTSTVSATSITVNCAFPNSIAVGDKAVWLPFSCGSHKVQTTTYLTQARADIASGTGIDCGVVDTEIELPISSTAPVVWVDFVLHDHVLDPQVD